MPDIRQLLVDAAAPPTRPLAVNQLIERAHHRRTHRWRRWLAGLAAAAAIGVPAGSLLVPAGHDGARVATVRPGPAPGPDSGQRLFTAPTGGAGNPAFAATPPGSPATRPAAARSSGGYANVPSGRPSHREDRVAYVKTSPGGSDGDLWIKNLATGTDTQLTSGSNDDRFPDWSPDGHRIVFTRDSSLFLINDNGTGLWPLTHHGSTGNVYAAWSPLGDRILFVAGTTRSSCLQVNCTDIFVVPADGSDAPRSLTTGTMPSWSPDGTHIVFSDLTSASCSTTYANGCDGTLFVVDSNGQGRKSLGRVGSLPRYSPDGTRIAYQTGQGTNADVHVTNSDGAGDRVVLGDVAEDDTEPVWASDGHHLIYRASPTTSPAGSPATGLFVCDDSGTGRVLIAANGDQPALRSITVGA